MVVVSFMSKWCIGKKMDICSKCGVVSLLWAPSWSGHNSGGILHIIILVKNVEICSKHLLTVGVVFVSRCYIGVKCWYLLRTSVHNWSSPPLRALAHIYIGKKYWFCSKRQFTIGVVNILVVSFMSTCSLLY